MWTPAAVTALWLAMGLPVPPGHAAHAGASAAEPAARSAGSSLDPADDIIMSREGYLAFHPDQHFRGLGVEALRQGRDAQARVYFQRAARYADKLSQAALAGMFWEGRGGARDPAMAFAWMDLAAERGTPALLARRDHYVRQLTAEERSRGSRIASALHDAYRDAVAKPRLERQLRRGLAQTTGSRLGWAGPLQVCVQASASGDCIDWVTGDQYYAARHWQPEVYWRVQDHVLQRTFNPGHVDVGPVQNLPSPEGPATRDRDPR